MHSDYQSVKEQSGIFAGDGGYTIDIAGHSHLEGGLVTSTRQAESQGLNRFKTGTLSYGDIANHANYRGSAMSMDGQITLAGQGGPKKVGNQQLLDVAKYAGESQRALGVGQTRDSQQSTTRSGINTANLEITDMARQQMQLNYQTAPAIQMNSGITVGNPHPVKRDNPVSLQAHLAGIKTDTDTQTVAQQAQALTNRFDKDKVQRELDFQVNTTKQFGQTLAEAKRQTKAHLLTNASEQTKQYVDWAFDTIGAGLTTGSVQAAGVAAVSPSANRTIKQLTTDRQTGETNLVTNTLAHAALGALEAKVTGNNAAAGAMAGAGGELAAHFAAKAYGVDGKTKTTQDLTEQEKATVKTLGQLGGMVAGGLIGDNSQSAVNSAQIAQRAVEHNNLAILARGAGLVCTQACQQTVAAALGIAIATELSSDDKQQALLAGMYRNPEQIAKLTSEQRDYLNELILAGDDSLLGNQVWIPNASGGFSPMDPSLVTINTGGKQIIDPRIVITNTGEVQYPTNNDLPRHTGGNQVIENDKTDHILTGGQTQIGDWRDGVLLENADQKYYPNPKLGDITGISGLKPAKPKTPVQGGGKLRARWKDSDGKIYEWDSQHGELEKYDKRGKHLGAFDYKTGDKIKPADPKRRIEP